MDEYRNVTLRPVPLASGRVLAPSETAELDLDTIDPQDQALVDDGTLLKATTDETNRPAATRRRTNKESSR